jgi:hypothetical protein
MSTDKDEQVAGGEASADYMISESGKQEEEVETTKGKKSSDLSSITDTIKEKVKDAKNKVVETKDKVTDTTKETI